ncbi:MAG TPA: ABC transporter ATP-binding protein [Candidatus Nanoarchaeia archaeon]|nr:ABC transporter ATP-binding protein [Candidatus Nanoarchaeia archaeon]
MEFIKLKQVSKEYSRKKVLEDVNLVIEEGDILGVVGESGSGKTTLLSLIAGFIEPTEGEVTYFSRIHQQERNLNRNIHQVKKHIGFTPQHNSFYPKLTVKENLLHFGRLYGLKDKTLLDNITGLLSLVRLMEHQNKLAGHLSGGMQKRLDISCSLIHKPKILVLDEPTADLDPLLRKDILNLLQEANKQGITIVLASHDLENVEDICNKVAFVHQGKVHTQGLIDEIKKPFQSDSFTISVRGKEKERIYRYLKSTNNPQIIDLGDSLVVYPDNIQQTISGLLKIIDQERLNLHDLNFRNVPLKNIFEKITGRN